ncbi:MAG: PrsW family glutamic-type intramembrane protease [Acidobacteriota bacterium]
MKLQLRIDGGSLSGRTFELESGFLTVGRGETCSIRFDPLSERIASKQHAFIEAKADGFYLTDNQSTNGTLLNGSVITTAKLSNGDQIQFGRNGVTAAVTIDGSSGVSVPQENFRARQIEQFNQIAAAGPVDVQNSISNLGLGSMAAVKPEPSKTGKYIGIGVTIFVILFLSMIVALIMFASVGPVAAVIATVVAFLPAALYILPLVWLDRYDPEPFWLFALAFAWGALVAVVVSFVVNTVISVVIAIGVSPAAGEVVGAVISAPIFEEGSKGLGVLVILIFFRKYFDDILDGIVFAGVIALGFATVENVLYYGRGIATGGVGGLATLFVLRGIMSPFAHVTFTSMTGIGCGIARESHKTFVRIIMPIVGYLGAVTLHAIWNGLAVIGGLQGFVAGYIVIEIPFFLIFVGFSWYVMHRQGKILKEMLAIDMARGLISDELGKTVTSPIKSSVWLVKGLFAGKYKARSHYLRAAGKLGLSYWHIQRATAARGQTGSFQQNPILREEVLKWRDQV